jgi:hypothetical protein
MFRVDLLTVFGIASVAAMLLFYSLEDRSPGFVLAFAMACWLAAGYAWLAGTWPFTAVEGLWGLVALRRFTVRMRYARDARP